MWSLSDESLLAGLGAGDPESATAFVRRFQGRVFGLALTMLGDREAAIEVTQETFVRAWRHADAYDPRRGRVASWLLTIARNVALDFRRLRRDEPFDPQAIPGLPRHGEDPAESAAASQERERLLEAIAALSEEQRRALLLAAFGGRTAREISRIEGIPLGTAKTRVRAAMLRLRSELEVGRER